MPNWRMAVVNTQLEGHGSKGAAPQVLHSAKHCTRMPSFRLAGNNDKPEHSLRFEFQ